MDVSQGGLRSIFNPARVPRPPPGKGDWRAIVQPTWDVELDALAAWGKLGMLKGAIKDCPMEVMDAFCPGPEDLLREFTFGALGN